MTLRHRSDCAQEERDVQRWRGRQGDLMERCGSCGRIAQVGEELRRPERAAELFTSNYYCREHLNPVTFKGFGCLECAEDKAERQALRDKAKEESGE